MSKLADEFDNEMFNVELNKKVIGHVWQTTHGWAAEVASNGNSYDSIDSRQDAEQLIRSTT